MEAPILYHLLVDLENIQPTAEEICHLLPGCQVLVFARANDKITVELAMTLERSATCEFILIEHSGKNALDFHIACKLGMLSQEVPNSFAYVISKDTGYDSVIAWLNKSSSLTVKRTPSFKNLPKNVCRPRELTSAELDTASPDHAKIVGFLPLTETAQSSSPPNETVTAEAGTEEVQQQKKATQTSVASPAQPYGTLQENAEKAIANLQKYKQARPRKRKTLMNTFSTCFGNELPEKMLVGLLNYLVTSKKCIILDEKDNVSYAPPITKK